jgi:hypothetical protein
MVANQRIFYLDFKDPLVLFDGESIKQNDLIDPTTNAPFDNAMTTLRTAFEDMLRTARWD